MVFAKTWSPHRWTFVKGVIDQVKTYKYLGIHFSYNLTWITHRNAALNAARMSLHAILRFFYKKGGRHIPAALKLFKAKALPQILYGCPVWMEAIKSLIEQPQALFLRKILGLPNCVPYAVLCLETGLLKIETQAWLRISSYWLKLYFSYDEHSLLHHLLIDSHSKPNAWQKKLKSIGIWTDILAAPTQKEAFRLIKTRFLDIHQQELFSEANKTCSPLHHQISVQPGQTPNYLSLLEDPRDRRAISLARCNVVPSEVMWGRFKGIEYIKRLCPCAQGVVESLDHLIFHCPRHDQSRQHYLVPLFDSYPHLADKWSIK